jgi:hypothetical protein
MCRILPKITSWWRAIHIKSPWWYIFPFRYQFKILISFLYPSWRYFQLWLLLFLFVKPLRLGSQHLVLELGIQHLGRMIDWRRWRRWPTVPDRVFSDLHLTFLRCRPKQIQGRNLAFWCLLAPFFHIFTIFNWIRELLFRRDNSFRVLSLVAIIYLFNLGDD